MHSAVTAFVEQMGLVAEANGFSRIGGRIIGLLLVEDRRFSLDDIVERLHVSKGSVSTNARMLARVGIIDRRSIPGDRRDYYRIGDQPWIKMHDLFQQRITRLLRAFENGLDDIPKDMADTRRRLETWRSFYAFMLEDTASAFRRWEAWLEAHTGEAVGEARG